MVSLFSLKQLTKNGLALPTLELTAPCCKWRMGVTFFFLCALPGFSREGPLDIIYHNHKISLFMILELEILFEGTVY